MKDYVALWSEGPPNKKSRILAAPVTVIGEWTHGPKSEFARVQLTVHPADAFDVVEKLGVGWPDPLIFGLLDALMNAEPNPLRNVRVILERAWYHDVDSSRNAFRNAGRDAGRKIIAAIDENGSRT
jgi:translation elongation factor EF-G